MYLIESLFVQIKLRKIFDRMITFSLQMIELDATFTVNAAYTRSVDHMRHMRWLGRAIAPGVHLHPIISDCFGRNNWQRDSFHYGLTQVCSGFSFFLHAIFLVQSAALLSGFQVHPAMASRTLAHLYRVSIHILSNGVWSYHFHVSVHPNF